MHSRTLFGAGASGALFLSLLASAALAQRPVPSAGTATLQSARKLPAPPPPVQAPMTRDTQGRTRSSPVPKSGTPDPNVIQRGIPRDQLYFAIESNPFPWWAKLYSEIAYGDRVDVANNRIGKGGSSLSDPQSVGDFLTPEQTIGQLNMKEPWESCITICNQWAWKPNDQMKTLKQCIQTLEKTAGGNGNLLFNVGPMMDGRMEARQVTRLKEMGDWLKKYGERTYATILRG